MATVKKELNPADLSIHLKMEKDVRVATVTHRDGFIVARREPFQSSAFELELTRVLASLGVEPEHELAATRDELERERAKAVRELGEVRAMLHEEQALAGSLTDKVAELESEKSSLSSRVALVERERTELLGRVTAYDNAAREMSKMTHAGDDAEREGPPTKPGKPQPQP